MTTLTHIHTPHKEAISFDKYAETKYTFCEDCEQNIESFYIDSDGDRLSMWSKWEVSK